MSDAITLAGVVLADGSLRLSAPVRLPQGAVEVTVRPAATRAAETQHNGLAHARTNPPASKPAAKPLALDAKQPGDDFEIGGGD